MWIFETVQRLVVRDGAMDSDLCVPVFEREARVKFFVTFESMSFVNFLRVILRIER